MTAAAGGQKKPKLQGASGAKTHLRWNLHTAERPIRSNAAAQRQMRDWQLIEVFSESKGGPKTQRYFYPIV